MTYRAKPVVRPRRSLWETPERRNLLLNLGFGLVVVVALLVLVAAIAYSWYDAHLAPVASVNGQSITKDEFGRRFDVESARLSIADSRIADEINAGRLTPEQGQAQRQFIAQRRDQLAAITIERLIDARVQAALAEREGIQVSPADVEAQIAREATRPEQRHAWLIEVEPDVEEGAEEPTAAAVSAARTAAQDALADLESGTDWVEVSKDASTTSTAEIGGDLGWITEESDLDQTTVEALFAIEQDAHTDVIEGEDGVFRIGRVTEIATERVDADYRALMADRGVPAEVYEAAVRDDLYGERLREKIEAQALAPGEQREVAEIFLEHAGLPENPPPGAVKTRHILYAPKDDPQAAAQVPAEDPAWKEAEEAAREAYRTLQADASRFDELAREESDEDGADISGGKLPWFDPSQSEAQGGGLDQAFATAIFGADLEPGDVLEPVRSKFGWHVIQILYYPTDLDQANRLREQLASGADFADLARDYSYAPEAAEGGEIGWVARLQLDGASEEAIFATPVGEVSEPVPVDGSGVHLYKVLAEEVREPDGDQRAQIEAEAFANWYEEQKAAFTIDREFTSELATS